MNPLTAEQIINHVLTELDPALATKLTNGDQARMCTTPVYDSITTPHGVITLERRVDPKMGMRKYAAIYIRVSTEKQSEDGYSAAEQLRRAIAYCTLHRLAFRVFSDVGLSGGLAINEKPLIAELLRSKARRYQQVFDRILLPEDENRTDAETASLVAYRTRQIKQILGGLPLDEEMENEQHYRDLKVRFRPALTILMHSLADVDTLLLSDLSRLARSQHLFANLTRRLAQRNVAVVGLIESLEYLKDDGDTGELIALLLAKMAEFKLRESVTNAIRSIIAMLQAGKPHSKLPFWLERDAEKFAQFKRDKDGVAHRAEDVRRAIGIFTSEDIGAQGISTRPQHIGITPPEGEFWSRSQIAKMLRNKALIGFQTSFGKDWPILPPVLVTADEQDGSGAVDIPIWNEIQSRIAGRRIRFPAYTKPDPTTHVLAGLIRCSCGSMVQHWRRSKTAEPAQHNCAAPRSKRESIKGHAFTLSKQDTEPFFDRLIEQHYRVLLDRFASSREQNDLMENIRVTEKRLRGLDVENATAAEMDLVRAREEVRVLPSLSQTESVIRAMAAAFGADREVEARQLRVDLERQRLQAEAIIPEDTLVDVAKRMERWRTLTDGEKNQILLQIFDVIQVEGERNEEILVPRLRSLTGGDLPPIRLHIWVKANLLLPIAAQLRGESPRRSRNDTHLWSGWQLCPPTVSRFLNGILAYCYPRMIFDSGSW